MKFDDLLAQYLYEKKSLQLQGIGTFQLDGAVVLPQPQDKQIYYPIEGLQFTFSPKDQTNEDLITFLVTKLGKIQPLVRSDLESYLSNIKQFINIGKPYTIEGIGTLQKNNKGTYEFSPGNFLPVKEELSQHKDNPERLQRQRARKNENRRSATIILVIAGAVILLGGIIWGITFLMNKNNGDNYQEAVADVSQNNAALAPDTLANLSSVKPSTALISDTASVDFKFIFDITTSRNRILSRTELLKREGIKFKIDTLTLNNELNYRMYIPRTLRFTDTLKVKDSLRLFFAKPIVIERRQ